MLVLAVWTRFWICKTSLPNRLTFFLENLTSLAKNKYMCGRFNRWINSVFQMISKNMGRETESELSRPSLFHRSEARSTKIVLSGGTFRLSWVSQPIASVLLNESWKFEYYRTPRHKCKTPLSRTAFLSVSSPTTGVSMERFSSIWAHCWCCFVVYIVSSVRMMCHLFSFVNRPTCLVKF